LAFDCAAAALVLTIDTDGVRILAAYAVVNPAKPKGLAPLDASTVASGA
jgi:hypothetical protein